MTIALWKQVFGVDVLLEKTDPLIDTLGINTYMTLVVKSEKPTSVSIRGLLLHVLIYFYIAKLFQCKRFATSLLV